MNSLRLLLSLALLSLTTTALAQSDAAKSDAQKSFDQMKTLAGEWDGVVIVDPPMAEMGGDKPIPMHITMRITSRGNALVHEMQAAGTPLDPSKYDHPVTMFYLDSDHLNLVHYCDAGNRPHMIARSSPDGKKIEFDFSDLSGGNDMGHMYHAVFTMVDATHHVEDWTYLMPGDKPMHAHFEARRAN